MPSLSFRARTSAILTKVLAVAAYAMTAGVAFASARFLPMGEDLVAWSWAHAPAIWGLWILAFCGGMLVGLAAAIGHVWVSASHGIVWKVLMTLALLVGTPLAAIPYYLFEARWRARVMREVGG